MRQSKSWLQQTRELAGVTDRLGAPIDSGILDTVIALQLLGLNTFSSCVGHPGRLTGGPYVMFEAVEAQELEPQLSELNPGSEAFRALRPRLVQANLLERAKLLPVLDQFYVGRGTPFEDRLVIEGIGREANRLKVQGIELMHVESATAQRDRLRRAQVEMAAFTGFLSDFLKVDEAAA